MHTAGCRSATSSEPSSTAGARDNLLLAPASQLDRLAALTRLGASTPGPPPAVVTGEAGRCIGPQDQPRTPPLLATAQPARPQSHVDHRHADAPMVDTGLPLHFPPNLVIGLHQTCSNRSESQRPAEPWREYGGPEARLGVSQPVWSALACAASLGRVVLSSPWLDMTTPEDFSNGTGVRPSRARLSLGELPSRGCIRHRSGATVAVIAERTVIFFMRVDLFESSALCPS